MFAHRRLQHAIVAKVIEYGVPVIIVDPRNTSSVPPMNNETRGKGRKRNEGMKKVKATYK